MLGGGREERWGRGERRRELGDMGERRGEESEGINGVEIEIGIEEGG